MLQRIRVSNQQIIRKCSSNKFGNINPQTVLKYLNSGTSLNDFDIKKIEIIDTPNKIFNFIMMFSPINNFDDYFNIASNFSNNRTKPFTNKEITDYRNIIKESIKQDFVDLKEINENCNLIFSTNFYVYNNKHWYDAFNDNFGKTWYRLDEKTYKQTLKYQYNRQEYFMQCWVENNNINNNLPPISYNRCVELSKMLNKNYPYKLSSYNCFGNFCNITRLNIFMDSIIKYSFVENILYPNDKIVRDNRHLVIEIEKYPNIFNISHVFLDYDLKTKEFYNLKPKVNHAQLKLLSKFVFLKCLPKIV